LEEAKLMLVLVLQRFCFHLSPNYCHAPHDKVTLKPRYGVPMILELLLIVSSFCKLDIPKFGLDFKF
jgi:hypothetical protein